MRPSDVVRLSVRALETAFPELVEVEGRIVARRHADWSNDDGERVRFVNLDLVDADAEGSTVRLRASTTERRLRQLLAGSRLDPAAVTAEGAVVVATGRIRGMNNTGAPRLSINTIVPAGVSDHLLDRERLLERIRRERLGQLRLAVRDRAGVVRRVAVIGSRTGFEDVRSGLRAARHLPQPALCEHEISPHSVTAVVEVPRLIAAHLAVEVDAILLAFGGHLPVPSPWDTEPVIDAIADAHRAGVPVLAGFAHAADRPLAKEVAFDLQQASAAARRLVERNDLAVEPLLQLSRCVPAISARNAEGFGRVGRAGQRAVVRVRRHRMDSSTLLERAAVTVADVTGARLEERRGRLARVQDAPRLTAARTQAAEQRLRRLVTNVSRTRERVERSTGHLTGTSARLAGALSRRVETAQTDRRATATRSASRLERRPDEAAHGLRATSLIGELLHNGWAVVTTAAGGLVTSPTVGSRIVVRTLTSRFEAVVDRTDREDRA